MRAFPAIRSGHVEELLVPRHYAAIPDCQAGLRAPALPLRFGTMRDRETIDSELRLIAACAGRPLIWARRSRASTWPMSCSTSGSSLARLARQKLCLALGARPTT